MVSLAEPRNRNRNRYNLTPRGKPLFEDDTRFGTKMLEKMGWSKGKGLGANEDGSAEFVRVRYKHDAEGLGYEARDDQWTQHEQSFNGLLETLNGNGEDATAGSKSADEQSDVEMRTIGFGFSDQSEKKNKQQLKSKISGQSLEEKSKKSRARVHYKKFTRGKDLAQYSEKDLANIFGKKSLDAAPETSADNIINEEQPTTNEERGEHFHSSSLSVSDYFKQKMNSLKEQKLPVDNCDEGILAGNAKETETVKKSTKRERNSIEVETSEVVVKKKKKNNNEKSEESKLEEVAESEHNLEEETKAVTLRKKKKNRKEKSEKVKDAEVEKSEVLNLQDETNRTKKTKKKQRTIEELEEELMKEANLLKKKKSSKNENKTNEECEIVNMKSVATAETKAINGAEENNEIKQTEIIAEKNAPKTKKSRKERKKNKIALAEGAERLENSESQAKPQEIVQENNFENFKEIVAENAEQQSAEKSINYQSENVNVPLKNK